MAREFSKISNFVKTLLAAFVLTVGAGGAAMAATDLSEKCWNSNQIGSYFAQRDYQLVTVEPGTNRGEFIVHASKRQMSWAFSFDACRRKVMDKWPADQGTLRPE